MITARSVIALLALLIALALTRPSSADTVATARSPATATAAADADHAALRALVAFYERAASEGKPELFEPYLAPDFSGVMVTGDAVGGAQSLKDYWATMRRMLGDTGGYRVKINLAGPATIVGDMAVANGTSDDVATRGGKEYAFQGQWTAVLHKIGGEWKVQRVHASMFPLSNPFVAELVRDTALLWAAIAGVSGLVVGWLVRLLLTRARRA